jgi:tungstate transport system substrate-binding protein
MSKKAFALFVVIILTFGMLAACGATPEPTMAPAGPASPPEPTTAPSEPATAPQPDKAQNLILATTTSTEDSGLLSYLLPFFQEECGVAVEVIAVGTGQALQLGKDGNADVVLVHARSSEDAFMDEGHGVRREDVMYNDFVIVGPPDDAAGVGGMTDAAQAFAQIAEAEATFVSRGDDSGTHTKEKAIWSAAGVEPSGDWYVSAGQGMGAVLTMADELQAYTLSDRATYLARTLEGTDLFTQVEGDPILFNPYGVMAVNPDKSPEIKLDLANQFIDWLISVPTQEKISEFGVDQFGAPLFTPDSDPWREANPGGAANVDRGPAGSKKMSGPCRLST